MQMFYSPTMLNPRFLDLELFRPGSVVDLSSELEYAHVSQPSMHPGSRLEEAAGQASVQDSHGAGVSRLQPADPQHFEVGPHCRILHGAPAVPEPHRQAGDMCLQRRCRLPGTGVCLHVHKCVFSLLSAIWMVDHMKLMNICLLKFGAMRSQWTIHCFLASDQPGVVHVHVLL